MVMVCSVAMVVKMKWEMAEEREEVNPFSFQHHK